MSGPGAPTPPAAPHGGGPVVVGLSIPVPAPYDAALAAWRHDTGDPLADKIAPHITVIPPTPVAAGEVATLLCDLRSRCDRYPAFPVRLRGTGTFRPVSNVVFVSVSDGIADCEMLADLLSVGPLTAPRDFPYHPHVTVAHDVHPTLLDLVHDGLADFRADFTVDAVWAHQQLPDGSWEPLDRLGLRDPLALDSDSDAAT